MHGANKKASGEQRQKVKMTKKSDFSSLVDGKGKV
jgi:hypothetical protein